MSSLHRSVPRQDRIHRSVGPPRSLPFFEFMLYGADAFAGASDSGRLVPVTRGRSLTLVPAPRAAPSTIRARRGA